jgi:hypothetical protein
VLASGEATEEDRILRCMWILVHRAVHQLVSTHVPATRRRQVFEDAAVVFGNRLRLNRQDGSH